MLWRTISSPRAPSMLGAAALASAACMVLFPAPVAAGTIEGVDVSRFNGKVDWDRVATHGVRFAYLAASRGGGADCTVKPASCGPDPRFARNLRRARAAGIRVGSYHRAFLNGAAGAERARADALREARVFVSQVGELTRGELLPALDLESPFGGVDAARLRLWTRTWLRKVRKRLGVRPLIYTNPVSWQATGDTAEFADSGHRLWIAGWGVRSPSVPAGNWAGRGWALWQFTNSGHVAGIAGRVDMDRLGVRFRTISVPRRAGRAVRPPGRPSAKVGA